MTASKAYAALDSSRPDWLRVGRRVRVLGGVVGTIRNPGDRYVHANCVYVVSECGRFSGQFTEDALEELE